MCHPVDSTTGTFLTYEKLSALSCRQLIQHFRTPTARKRINSRAKNTTTRNSSRICSTEGISLERSTTVYEKQDERVRFSATVPRDCLSGGLSGLEKLSCYRSSAVTRGQRVRGSARADTKPTSDAVAAVAKLCDRRPRGPLPYLSNIRERIGEARAPIVVMN